MSQTSLENETKAWNEGGSQLFEEAAQGVLSTRLSDDYLSQDETQWVIFELDNQSYAFPVETVREMVILPGTASIPHAPPSILGISKLRDATVPVMDLRTRLGMQSSDIQRIELLENLKARKHAF